MSTREGKQLVTMTRYTKIFSKSQTTERDTRIDTPSNVGPTTPKQEAAMKAFIVKADTAQSTTQWYWRTPTSSRYREPLRPDLTDSRTRCCNLFSHGS